ncbi:MAG TPA: hypothetical protein VI485_10305 [Vicinamibacterales bacterium]|nr:hypothetical protein [Vicinamibacterales bacterium]
MLGRRSYTRVAISAGAEGVLSLARDVGIHLDNGQLVAISREPGVLGETVVVAVPDEGVNILVEIVESRPFITDGAVRHRLWLRRLNTDRDANESNANGRGR